MRRKHQKRYARGFAGKTTPKANLFYLLIAGGALVAVIAKKRAIVGAVAQVMGYVAGKETPLTLVTIDTLGHQLSAPAATSFMAMRTAAAQAGINLVVTTAFRDMAFQEKLYAMWLAGTGNLAAQPGYSNHQSGIALDIETAGGTNAAFAWLNLNAKKYGWKRTVSSEPWHWEYLP